MRPEASSSSREALKSSRSRLRLREREPLKSSWSRLRELASRSRLREREPPSRSREELGEPSSRLREPSSDGDREKKKKKKKIGEIFSSTILRSAIPNAIRTQRPRIATHHGARHARALARDECDAPMAVLCAIEISDFRLRFERKSFVSALKRRKLFFFPSSSFSSSAFFPLSFHSLSYTPFIFNRAGGESAKSKTQLNLRFLCGEKKEKRKKEKAATSKKKRSFLFFF